MRWYRQLLPSLPEELSGWIGLSAIPPGPPFPEELWGRTSCFIVWCYTGPHDRAGQVLDPVRTYGSPLLGGVQPMPFTAIEVHVKFGKQLPTLLPGMHLYPIDGAASRVPQAATAFAYRDDGWACVIAGVDPDPANAERRASRRGGQLASSAPAGSGLRS